MKKPIYLDYMATTPIDESVIRKMLTCMGRDGDFGNPASSSHSYGWQASERVEFARGQVAKLLGADSREIIWTSGATEANNLAIIGAGRFYARKGKHIVTSKTEHKAVLDTCRALEREGFEVSYLTPEPSGLLDLDVFRAALRKDTVLASIMHVNNETGVIQDIAALGAITRAHGVLLHVDAAQSVGRLPINLAQLPVDLLSCSAHKVYGPKGMGALYVRRTPRVRLSPLIHGGGHEQGLRSGTLATHQIVGMGEACELAGELMKAGEQTRLAALRDRLWQGLQILPDIYLNGHAEKRVAENLNVSVGGVDGEALLLGLRDLAVSSGSACTSATILPSHVLSAMGVPDPLAHSAIRFSLGRYTTEADIHDAIRHIIDVVTRLRHIGSLDQ